jgi:hypothetical protein
VGLDKYRAARLRRRSIRELDRLSDRTLADIGLHRSEIVSVVNELVAGGTRANRGAPKPADVPATVNDNVTKIAA